MGYEHSTEAHWRRWVSAQLATSLNLSGGTVAGALTVQGAFTSRGIDDNATARSLTVGNNVIRVGNGTSAAVSTIEVYGTDNGRLDLNGGNLAAARIQLFGSTHATTAYDIVLRTGPAQERVMVFDESVGDMEFSTGIGAKTAALTIDASQNATFSGNIVVTGTVDGVDIAARLIEATTAQLEDIAHSINTSADKVLGRAVYNSTTGVTVFAAGDTDGAVWQFHNATTAHTPA